MSVESGSKEPTGVESEVDELRIATDRCRNFLSQETPLSEQGKQMEALVEEALAEENSERLVNIAKDLSTVEDPKLNLFGPFRLDDRQKQLVFGQENLSAVQLTNGCTHGCTMCNPEKKLTLMPGITVAQIGKEIEQAEKVAEQDWDDWAEHLKKLSGVDINEIDLKWLEVQMESGPTPEFVNLIHLVEQEYSKHAIAKYYKETNPSYRIQIDPNDLHPTLQTLAIGYPVIPAYFQRQLNVNYYGDGFDWRSTSLRHENGKPADFGDAFRWVAHPLRPIFVSTAGWSKGDPLGPIAAAKIVETVKEAPYLLRDFRLSISSTEKLARESLQDYHDHMIGVIDGLQGIPFRVVFIYDQDGSDLQRDFEDTVQAPLVKYLDELRSHLSEREQQYFYHIQNKEISHWNQRDVNPEFEEHVDPAACMGGIHILPNWQIAIQQGSYRQRPPKGSRPQLTGLSLY